MISGVCSQAGLDLFYSSCPWLVMILGNGRLDVLFPNSLLGKESSWKLEVYVTVFWNVLVTRAATTFCMLFLSLEIPIITLFVTHPGDVVMGKAVTVWHYYIMVLTQGHFLHTKFLIWTGMFGWVFSSELIHSLVFLLQTYPENLCLLPKPYMVNHHCAGFPNKTFWTFWRFPSQ